jgi:hypothetical protein
MLWDVLKTKQDVTEEYIGMNLLSCNSSVPLLSFLLLSNLVLTPLQARIYQSVDDNEAYGVPKSPEGHQLANH